MRGTLITVNGIPKILKAKLTTAGKENYQNLPKSCSS